MQLGNCQRLLLGVASAAMITTTAAGAAERQQTERVSSAEAQVPAPSGTAGASPPTEQSSQPEAGEIVVTGEAYAIRRAIDAKRAAPIVSDTISASEIGAIPEFGLGEALQRVPGVSFQINNGRGEAEFETIRGLNPDYNSVTLDG